MPRGPRTTTVDKKLSPPVAYIPAGLEMAVLNAEERQGGGRFVGGRFGGARTQSVLLHFCDLCSTDLEFQDVFGPGDPSDLPSDRRSAALDPADYLVRAPP